MELQQKVASLIADVDSTHRYSMSRIYNTHNEVFATKETPQSCASCLIRKVNQLRTWLSQQTATRAISPPQKKERKPKT